MMKNHVMNKISYNCIGCGICEGVCPKNCIVIEEKSNKGIVPIVDETKCIDCGICLNYCPTEKLSENENVSNIKKVYTGYSKDNEIIKKTSSGGIVTSTLVTLFKNNNIDAALVAFIDKNLNVYGDFITNEEEVLDHSGSFYHTSKMLVNIKKIKKYKSIAFVGLPCQNIALERFIKKNNVSNIFFKISIFCTIGRMKNGFDEFLKSEGIDKENITSYKPRVGEIRPGNLVFETMNNNQITINNNNNFYQMDYFYLPKGCMNCKKLFGNEYSDISVGDDWGDKRETKIAIFSINSEKGQTIIDKNNLIWFYHENSG